MTGSTVRSWFFHKLLYCKYCKLDWAWNSNCCLIYGNEQTGLQIVWAISQLKYMVLQCITNGLNFLMISRTEYTFLSQQSVMSVRKRAGFLSPNRISELVCDRENEEAGALNDWIIYLCNRILCIFRQLLKYLCLVTLSLTEKGNNM
jgi:hypothetical protein